MTVFQPPEIGPETVVWPNPYAAEKELDDELILFAPHTGPATTLNSSARILWPFFDGRSTIGELAADLAAAFEIQPAQAVEDVRALVAALSMRDLVRSNAMPWPEPMSWPPAPADRLPEPGEP